MSDNESDEEQQQQMEKNFICADVLLGAFAFLDPRELGLKLALFSDRLDVLVDVHFKSRKWSLGSMEIVRAIGGNGTEIVNKRSGERLPIPQGQLPKNVIGFECIEISYVDQSVLEFIQRFRRLFDSSGTNVYIGTDDDQSRSWEIIRQKIWPLVSHNICGLSLDPDFDRLRQISPTILRDCANLRSIEYIGSFLAFPAEDNAAADFDRAVAKWLITPRGDGLPKMFHSPFYSEGVEGVERVKGEIKAKRLFKHQSPIGAKSFVNASEPVNFIISFSLDGVLVDEDLVPFKLKNNLTGERLTFRQIDEHCWLLVRCPIEQEEDKWAKWEAEAIELDWYNHWNVFIHLFDSDIGGGLVEANEGPSEPNE